MTYTKDGEAMANLNARNWMLKSLFSLLSLSFIACNGKPDQTIPISFIVITDAAKSEVSYGQVVKTSPITITAGATSNGKGTMEIFDGDKSLGVLNIKESVDSSNLGTNKAFLEIPLTKTDNGVHTYKARFIGTSDNYSGTHNTMTEPVIVTVQIP